MNDRARARNTAEKALTDIDIRADESAIERLAEAAELLAGIESVEIDGDMPDIESAVEEVA